MWHMPTWSNGLSNKPPFFTIYRPQGAFHSVFLTIMFGKTGDPDQSVAYGRQNAKDTTDEGVR